MAGLTSTKKIIGSRIQKNTGGISQLVKSSGDGKRPGYGGPQDWGQQEKAEKVATGQASWSSPQEKASNPYSGASKEQLQSYSVVSPSHGGMNTQWSQDDTYQKNFNIPGADPSQEPEGIKAAKEELQKKAAANQFAREKLLYQNKLKKPNWVVSSLYNRFPNSNKNEIAYLRTLKSKGHYLPPELESILEAAIQADLEGTKYDTKLTAEQFAMMKALQPQGNLKFSQYMLVGDPIQGVNPNPGLFMGGDLGNFYSKPQPDWWDSAVHGNWEQHKNKIIQDMGLSTGGNDNQQYTAGGDPGDPGDPGDGDDDGDGGGGGGDPGSGIVYPYANYGTPSYQTSDTFMNLAYPGGSNFLLAKGGRVPAASGGIMDTTTGRKGFFLGGIGDAIGDALGGVAKAAGKVLKSPIGQAALLYAGGTYLGGMKAFGGAGTSGFFSRLRSPSNLANLFKVKNWSQGNLLNPLLRSYDDKLGKYTGLSPVKGILSLSTLPFAMQALGIGQPKQDPSLMASRKDSRLTDPLTGEDAKPAEMRASLNDALSAAWNEDKQAYESEAMAAIKQAYPFLGQYPIYKVKDGGRIGYAGGGYSPLGTGGKTQLELPFGEPDYYIGKGKNRVGIYIQPDGKRYAVPIGLDGLPSYAQGGRVPAQEGGLMDLGGLEKDYRNEGGFVPIGREERADDVPARLSVNEFVFTADAVRNAGGGDIDKGAEIMENMMKNLENGGRISEESQGNTGAQEMFSVSERIGEVI